MRGYRAVSMLLGNTWRESVLGVVLFFVAVSSNTVKHRSKRLGVSRSSRI